MKKYPFPTALFNNGGGPGDDDWDDGAADEQGNLPGGDED